MIWLKQAGILSDLSKIWFGKKWRPMWPSRSNCNLAHEPLISPAQHYITQLLTRKKVKETTKSNICPVTIISILIHRWQKSIKSIPDHVNLSNSTCVFVLVWCSYIAERPIHLNIQKLTCRMWSPSASSGAWASFTVNTLWERLDSRLSWVFAILRFFWPADGELSMQKKKKKSCYNLKIDLYALKHWTD